MSYGAASAMLDENLSLEKMLIYAIQDEYLAREEYDIAIRIFGDEKPFPNIINSEVNHINWLKTLFTKYNLKIPQDESKKYLPIPCDFKCALEGGIRAEMENITMYDSFLSNDIPNAVTPIFTKLRDASKGHLFILKKTLDQI